MTFEDLTITGLVVLAAYAALGLVFGIAFVLRGAARIDPVARNAPLAFRVAILPGAVAFWPVLLKKWLSLRNATSPTAERVAEPTS